MDNPENISAYSLLEFIKPGMKVCEIGVRSGQSSEMFLEKGAFVYMIDPWEDYNEYPEKTYRYQEDYELTLSRIKKYEGNYVILRKKSDDVIEEVPSDLDLVYIDGNHTVSFVKRDILNYWPKIKSGGWMTGDDWSMDEVMGGILLALVSLPTQGLNIKMIGRNWAIQKP